MWVRRCTNHNFLHVFQGPLFYVMTVKYAKAHTVHFIAFL